MEKQIHENSHKNQYMTMPQSELQVIAGWAVAKRRVETCGSCFGLWSRGGRPVLSFVTSHGPKAVLEYSYCQEDPEFFHRTVREIDEAYGAQLLGNHHNHHELGLAGPSDTDLEQVRSVCQRNNFRRWMGIITTFADAGLRDLPREAGSAGQTGRADGVPRIAVHAFIYEDPIQGKPFRCPIRVLPGVSPLRLAIMAAGKRELGGQGEFFSDFPMDRIVYDAYTPGESCGTECIPRTLVTQLQELTALGLEENLDLYLEEGLVIVTLPLLRRGVVEVALDEKAPHLVQAVQVRRDLGQPSVGLSQGFCNTTIVRLYARLQSLDPYPIVGASSYCHRIGIPAGSRDSKASDALPRKQSALTDHPGNQRRHPHASADLPPTNELGE